MSRNTFDLHGAAESENDEEEIIPRHSPSLKTSTFSGNGEFFLLKLLLRILSLWHPKSNFCLMRYLCNGITGIVSFLLACTATCYAVVLVLSKDVGVTRDCIGILTSIGGLLSYLFASFYFRSRDIEDNMIPITFDLSHLREFRRHLMYYNIRIVISTIVFVNLICGLAISTSNGSRMLTTNLIDAVYPYHDTCRECLIWLVFAAQVHMSGAYFAIVLVVDLLQLMSNVRLHHQLHKFTKWTKGAEAAIHDHMCNYIFKIEKSCSRLKWWFLIHNVFLIILVPLDIIGNLDLTHSDKQTIFSALLEIGTIAFAWLLPLYFAEKIERHDKNFLCAVNNLSLSANTNSQETAILTIDSEPNEESIQNLTFTHRTEVQLLVDYLKNIRSGFRSVGYAFQLKLSLISTMISATVLIFKIHNGTGIL